MALEATIEIDGQYRALRESAGTIDRSARGKLVVRGPEAAEYLQGQLTNDVEALGPGDGCYAALLDRKGHMQADMRVLRMAPDELWLDVEPTAAEAAQRHLQLYKVGRDAEVLDAGAQRAILSVIGPAAAATTGVEGLTPEHTHRPIHLDGLECVAAATDLGVDLLVEQAERQRLLDALALAGAAEVSEEAAEILRVEAGRPRFGAEMTTSTIPEEAGINERAVSFTKGCYIGQETVARLHYKGKPNRHLRGLRLSAPADPGAVLRLGEKQVGSIGTACLSPALGPIALAVVRREAAPGDRLSVGEGDLVAEVAELPFRI